MVLSDILKQILELPALCILEVFPRWLDDQQEIQEELYRLSKAKLLLLLTPQISV